jgi:hypothetical protein
VIRLGDSVMASAVLVDSRVTAATTAVLHLPMSQASSSAVLIPGPPGRDGITDHGLLNGLSDDDHSQYHNDMRGDARYYTKSQVDAAIGASVGLVVSETDPKLTAPGVWIQLLGADMTIWVEDGL